MKYWLNFVNFVFWLLSYVKRGIIRIARFIYALWEPVHVKIKPTAIVCIDWFNGKKTYIVSTFSILGLIVGYAQGSVNLSSLLSTLPCLVVAMTIRHGMARNAATAINELPSEPEKASRRHCHKHKA
jgi:hypothetical protein